MRPEEENHGHQNEPAEAAAGEQNARDPRSDNVTHAHIFRRGLSAQRGAREPLRLVVWSAGPRAQQVFVLEKRVERAQAEAKEDAAGEGASTLASNQHVSAGCAFGILEVAVLFHD